MLRIEVKSVSETYALAAILADLACQGDVITLSGELGVGKSEFARAFIQATLRRKEVVPSPTFTLLQQYETPPYKISHFDLYRLEDPDELFEIGFEEALHEGVTLIEWPEKLGGYRLKNCLDIEIIADAKTEVRSFCLDPDISWKNRIKQLEIVS